MCPNEAYNELLNLYLNAFNESFPIALKYHLKSNSKKINRGTHLVLECLRKQRLNCSLKNYQYLLNITYKNIKNLIYCIITSTSIKSNLF